jgi:hypothetical protein
LRELCSVVEAICVGFAVATEFEENKERISCLTSFLGSGLEAVDTGGALKSNENRSFSGAFACGAVGVVASGGINGD